MSAVETERPKLFSIVLVTYNCGRKVELTIKSVLSQNRDLFELIVVDGASNDDTDSQRNSLVVGGELVARARGHSVVLL